MPVYKFTREYHVRADSLKEAKEEFQAILRSWPEIIENVKYWDWTQMDMTNNQNIIDPLRPYDFPYILRLPDPPEKLNNYSKDVIATALVFTFALVMVFILGYIL